ncbi:DUF5343 domain-containing protein [Frondihabitans peucedani]|uniref:DUF5343 domain-containing protein n=1 Tax=Frondihabitans peucedani TaxID=598626 RepID=A0ABP8E6H5_9MICO
MANELPLTTNTASLTRFLTHIQGSGVPAKVDRSYLKSVGFKSGNDGYIIPVLKHIGFISTSGAPETRWRSYRDKTRAPKILAQGIQEGYADLFEVYPEAYRKDEEALRNWVRSKTEYDEVKVGHAVKTFQALGAMAEFDKPVDGQSDAEITPAEASVPIVQATVPNAAALAASPSPGATTPSFNINIELHLPPSADADTYDKFFAAMKKHLFPDASA